MDNPRYEDNDAYERHVELEMDEKTEREELRDLLYIFLLLPLEGQLLLPLEGQQAALRARVKAAIKKLEKA